MDKNQVTGLLLISLLLIVYMLYFSPELPQQPEQVQTVTQDTIGPSESTRLTDSSNSSIAEISQDSLLQAQYGFFAQALKGNTQEVILENKDIQITLNTYGGNVKKVVLKNYVTNQNKSLVLLNEQSSDMVENIQTSYGTFDLNQLYYRIIEVSKQALVLSIGNDKQSIIRTYRLAAEGGFLLSYDLDFKGLSSVIERKSTEFSWIDRIKKLEKSLKQSRYQSAVNYYTETEDFDYISGQSNSKEVEQIGEPVKWLSFKQKFFNAAIIAADRLENTSISAYADEEDTSVVTTLGVQFYRPIAVDASNQLKFYFGPNDYDICKAITKGFEKNVYLGWAIFAPINRIAIIPLFQWLEKYMANYGIIILVMVIIVKFLLFPLTYKSYVSMAKMKVLKPEMDAIKEKYGNDMQKAQQDNMKLYSQFGVNPFSGCIPMLAQMPVLLAMFNFFPNAIQLRQKEFLWADDLSSYDSILDLPFHIPFYGDHVSLFTLLMTVSTVVYTYFNNQMGASAAAQGPMKTMMYIMPVTIMFFLNDYSSGLTYYYFVSNIITIFQQLITRKLIDEVKIRKRLEENKKLNKDGGKSGSRFMQRLNNAMKAQEEMKRKNNNTATSTLPVRKPTPNSSRIKKYRKRR